jgi:hypothetical protein
VEYEERYGELTDEPEQMKSTESAVSDGSIIVCGRDMRELFKEMVRYLVTKN